MTQAEIELTKSINGGFVQVSTLLKTVNETLKGSQGDLTKLNTADKSSLVNALNEIKSLIGASSGGASINDSTTDSQSAWSSTKTSTEITKAIAGVIGGADESNDTLKEQADKLAGLMQADKGLISAKVAQSFTDTEKAQARSNIDVYSKAEIGDIANTNFVNTINTVFNS